MDLKRILQLADQATKDYGQRIRDKFLSYVTETEDNIGPALMQYVEQKQDLRRLQHLFLFPDGQCWKVRCERVLKPHDVYFSIDLLVYPPWDGKNLPREAETTLHLGGVNVRLVESELDPQLLRQLPQRT